MSTTETSRTDSSSRTSSSSTPSASPSQWPPEAAEMYEPIRVLGTGGFGSVLMAKLRHPTNKDDPDKFVAMKAIGGREPTKSEKGYAHREITVLSELSHPHIVRLIRAFEPKNYTSSKVGEKRCAIALSLHRGPTLEQLVRYGGALGLPMGQFITAQLINAVSYLHSRAVIHRDIKPDNIIVTGAKLEDEAVWTDGDEGTKAAKERRWHTTIIDFGFARALGPEQIEVDVGLYNTVHGVKAHNRDDDPAFISSVDAPLEDTSIKRGRDTDLDRSMSKKLVRNLSAVGNRNYAAPEVKNGVRPFLRKSVKYLSRRGPNSFNDESEGEDSSHGKRSRRGKQKTDLGQQTLADHVSDYGMVADAFSLGATIRHFLTGVPPNMSVDDCIAMQNNPLSVAGRFVGKIAGKMGGKKKKDDAKKKKKKRRIRYRPNDEMPKEAARLIKGLTNWDQRKRTTVRQARSYPWVSDAPGASTAEETSENDASEMHGRVQFLQCALPQEDKAAQTETTKASKVEITSKE